MIPTQMAESQREPTMKNFDESGPSIEELIEEATVGPKQEAMSVGPFTFYAFDEMWNEPAKLWLINGLVGKSDLAMIYGKGKTGKTLVAFDMMACLVRGNCLFADRFRVDDPVNVVYATAEGCSGLGGRIRGLQHKYDLTAEERDRLQILKQVPQLYSDESPASIRVFVEQYRREYGDRIDGGLLIVDTWARATVGANENNTPDTTLILNAMAEAARELNCTILAIHHANKYGPEGGGDLRGSSNIQAVFDNAIHVRRTGESRYLGCDIAKDAADTSAVGFKIDVHGWLDESGAQGYGPYVVWLGAAECQVSESLATDAEIVAVLRQHAYESALAMTSKQVCERMESQPAERTVRTHLVKMRKSETSIVQGEERQVTNKNDKPGRHAYHYWVEDERD